jgi:phosphate starvation-inducible PhoH-like protein
MSRAPAKRRGPASRADKSQGVKARKEAAKPARGAPAPALVIDFDDNSILGQLFGAHDRNLARIEHDLGVAITARGNRIAITGDAVQAQAAGDALSALYARLRSGAALDRAEVDATVRLAAQGRLSALAGAASKTGKAGVVEASRRSITPRTTTQAVYLDAMREYEMVFGLGPAGTGKTYLAVATAVAMLRAGEVDRIILSRPAVEAGERLGFLPGDIREKVDPYLRPLYDALYDMLPADQVVKRLANGEIEVAPLAFMRGRTLAHAFIILDEAQNTTSVQMKMCLTRMGEGSRMVVTGDMSQVDLPPGTRSGLADAAAALEDVDGVAFVRFTAADMVRHPLVTRVVRAYEKVERQRLTNVQRPRAPDVGDRSAKDDDDTGN